MQLLSSRHLHSCAQEAAHATDPEQQPGPAAAGEASQDDAAQQAAVDGGAWEAQAWSSYFASYDSPEVHLPGLRCAAYTRAWEEAIQHWGPTHIKGKVVLDLGCGPGLLSLLCAKVESGAARCPCISIPPGRASKAHAHAHGGHSRAGAVRVTAQCPHHVAWRRGAAQAVTRAGSLRVVAAAGGCQARHCGGRLQGHGRGGAAGAGGSTRGSTRGGSSSRTCGACPGARGGTAFGGVKNP